MVGYDGCGYIFIPPYIGWSPYNFYSQGGRYFVRHGLTYKGSTLTRGGDLQLVLIP